MHSLSIHFKSNKGTFVKILPQNYSNNKLVFFIFRCCCLSVFDFWSGLLLQEKDPGDIQVSPRVLIYKPAVILKKWNQPLALMLPNIIQYKESDHFCRSVTIPTAYSNLSILSKEKQAKNRTENQASKVTNWPFLANPFRFNQAAGCWKSPFPFSRGASSENSSQTAKITDRCRAQHVVPAAQEQTQSCVLRMPGRSGESMVAPSSPPSIPPPSTQDLVLFCNPTFGVL